MTNTDFDCYPTHFECVNDAKQMLFTVDMWGEKSAKVAIPTAVTLAQWDVIAPRIRKCLLAMRLEGGE